jgi:type II secretory pathway pseudopilin PulG
MVIKIGDRNISLFNLSQLPFFFFFHSFVFFLLTLHMPRFSPFVIVVSGIITGVGVIVTIRYTLQYQRQKQLDAQQEQQQQQQQQRQRRRSTRRRRQGLHRRPRRISTRNGQQQQQQNRRRSSVEGEHDDWLLPLHLDSDNDQDTDTIIRSDNNDDDTDDDQDDTSEQHNAEAPTYPNEQTDRLLSLFTEWQEDDDSDNKNLLQLLHSISENQARKGKAHHPLSLSNTQMDPLNLCEFILILIFII